MIFIKLISISTAANKLIQESNGLWSRVNQDEMGTRKACEQVARKSFKDGLSVVVDRCNFDFQQRQNWLKLAQEFGVNDFRF